MKLNINPITGYDITRDEQGERHCKSCPQLGYTSINQQVLKEVQYKGNNKINE